MGRGACHVSPPRAEGSQKKPLTDEAMISGLPVVGVMPAGGKSHCNSGPQSYPLWKWCALQAKLL